MVSFSIYCYMFLLFSNSIWTSMCLVTHPYIYYCCALCFFLMWIIRI
uniref:Uncharacterized protein n=1 Tax=Rhizophora mucronata TaxID=61149 RepID=A0A2P2IU61_RHIMU